MYTRNPEVPQTPASLAQMSLAQRTEQMVLQERMLESGQEMPLDEEQTVTLVQAASNLSPAQTIQLRGLSQVSSGVGGVPGATLQLTQLPGGQVVHILQPVPNERGENVVTLQGGSQLTQIRLFDPREGATFLDQVGRHNLSQEVAAHRAEERA